MKDELRRSTLEDLYDKVFSARARRDEIASAKALSKLREHILLHGIPDEQEVSSSSGVIEETLRTEDKKDNLPIRSKEMTLRGKIWKLLLGVDEMRSDVYLAHADIGRSNLYQKIRNDSFRTFPQDEKFQNVVPEPRIIRLLNAFVHEYGDVFGYVQGMNAICAPFLYVMPELDAYYAYCKYVTKWFPLYWIHFVSGAKAGCKLVDECLRIVDGELYDHLTIKNKLTCLIYGFHSVQSLSASVPPFSELIKLWDIFLAFGPHLNILSVVAQVILMRDELLASDKAKCQELLNARGVIRLDTHAIIPMIMLIQPRISIKSELYEKIRRHSFDPVVTAELINEKDLYFKPVGQPGRKLSK